MRRKKVGLLKDGTKYILSISCRNKVTGSTFTYITRYHLITYYSHHTCEFVWGFLFTQLSLEKNASDNKNVYSKKSLNKNVFANIT